MANPQRKVTGRKSRKYPTGFERLDVRWSIFVMYASKPFDAPPKLAFLLTFGKYAHVFPQINSVRAAANDCNVENALHSKPFISSATLTKAQMLASSSKIKTFPFIFSLQVIVAHICKIGMHKVVIKM